MGTIQDKQEVKLLSMTDFVLEQETLLRNNSDYTNAEAILKCINYANFLKQPLELFMFIPCDEDGNFLEEKKPFQDKYYEYQQAKERVLFDGFEIRNKNWISNGYIDIDEEFCQGLSIESLVKYNLKLKTNRIMKFKIEIWHSTTDFETIEIEAIDAIYATKFATQMYPAATKINVTKV